ncbi:UNVERIFIED_CONTAM: hypothetical protein HHA_453280 [Hammondia hammondi]|eukprot:XP_008886543.1 hypothetical protein HHA_453280 [Hammondia hammondi]
MDGSVTPLSTPDQTNNSFYRKILLRLLRFQSALQPKQKQKNVVVLRRLVLENHLLVL